MSFNDPMPGNQFKKLDQTGRQQVKYEGSGGNGPKAKKDPMGRKTKHHKSRMMKRGGK
jgi:hypothetical protein